MASLSSFAARKQNAGRLFNEQVGGIDIDAARRDAAEKASLLDDQNVQGPLSNVAFTGIAGNNPGSFKNQEELIKSRTGAAINLFDQGTGESQRLIKEAGQAAISPFQEIADDTRAFDEQQALLGLKGNEAQQAAIGNINVSDFDRQLQDRLQRSQLRQAAATGDLGSGATIDEAQTLAGSIQAQNIQKRLDELTPLVDINRNIVSDISRAEERTSGRLAQNILGSGTQKSNIRFGSAAPQIDSIQNRAELSGLRGIATARRQGQNISSLAQLAGQFLPTGSTADNRTVDPSTQNILV